MKKFLMTAFFCSSLSLPVFAAGFPFRSDIHLVPYAGVDAAMRYSPFQRNFGGNLFKQYYPEGNVFFGIKFSDYLGIELGYRTSVSKTRAVSLSAGEVAVGIPVQNPPELNRSTASFKGWHAELIGFAPIYGKDCVSLLASVGISRVKLFAKNKIVQFLDPATGLQNALLNGAEVHTFSRTKNMLTLGIGIQYAIDEKTYLRAKINWENSSSLKSIASREDLNAILKPRDSLSYGIGVVFNFL